MLEAFAHGKCLRGNDLNAFWDPNIDYIGHGEGVLSDRLDRKSIDLRREEQFLLTPQISNDSDALVGSDFISVVFKHHP